MFTVIIVHARGGHIIYIIITIIIPAVMTPATGIKAVKLEMISLVSRPHPPLSVPLVSQATPFNSRVRRLKGVACETRERPGQKSKRAHLTPL